MTDRYIGDRFLDHVQQPEGTELCFASIGAAVAGESIAEVDAALQAAFLSEEDGSTGIFFVQRTEVELGTGKTLLIDAVQGVNQEADTVEGVISNIDAKLQTGVPVALLYKKTDDPESTMHWVLLAGYSVVQDSATGEDITWDVNIIDPLQDDVVAVRPIEVVSMIERSMHTDGVFAYALSLKPATEPDQELETASSVEPWSPARRNEVATLLGSKAQNVMERLEGMLPPVYASELRDARYALQTQGDVLTKPNEWLTANEKSIEPFLKG